MSDDAKRECEMLLDALLPFAEKMLARDGMFIPVGAALTIGGEIAMVASGEEGARNPATDAIKALKAGLVQGAREGKYKATAIMFDVAITLPPDNRKSDAVALKLNHKSGYAAEVFFPYAIRNAKLEFSPPLARKGVQDIF